MGQNRLILGGQILFVGMLMLCFMLYLDLFGKDYYQRKAVCHCIHVDCILQCHNRFHGNT